MNGNSEAEMDSITALIQAAEAGQGAAGFELGKRYRTGRGVPRNYSKARHWYRIAAESGHVDAQNDLGSMLLNGRGGPVDKETALHWYEASAKQGSAVAQYNLAKRYQYGQGTDIDFQQAIYWFQQAARQHYASAACELGTVYVLGQGVPTDVLQGTEYHIEAAEAGDRVGNDNLSEDEPLLRILALQGSRQAAFALYRMSYGGFGVEKSLAAAWSWLRWAVEGCDPLPAESDKGHINSHVANASYWPFYDEPNRAAGTAVPDGDQILGARLAKLGAASEGDDQTILHILTEGGGFKLMGNWRRSGLHFRLEVSKSIQRECRGQLQSTQEPEEFSSWGAALKGINRYPWHMLDPLVVHPNFAPRIWRAWLKRSKGADQQPMGERWARLCGSAAGSAGLTEAIQTAVQARRRAGERNSVLPTE